MDALLESLEAFRLRLLNGGGHLLRDRHALSERAVHIDDVVLQVADLVIHQVDERYGLGVAEGFLQLHLFGGVHCLAELAPQDVEDLRHTQELVVGVCELEPQFLAALGGAAEEGFVFCARFRAAHRCLQHTQDGELLFQRHLRRGRRCAEVLDCLCHAGAGGLERSDGVGDASREHLAELHVAQVAVVVFINAVACGKQRGHLARRGLRRLCGQGREACELCDALIREGGDAALDVVGRADEVRLRRARPLIGEAACGVFDRFKVLHTQRGQLTQRTPRFKGRLYRGEHSVYDLRARLLHRRTRLCHAAEGLACGVQLGDVCADLGRHARHRPGEVVDHVHNERQLKYGL